ncbi:hypothetical protein ATI61_107502 [Archangium gephyra]|uniref:Lipoprotein n=1 Tax=Archangium gephyra TaxID=48 RepID=A0AAC8TJ64_9BACT|nr:hypothetical protein [Archangium gephyra]AKJ08067.1 Hypothetical protein AA314_09693 [Archangium gephyra]REG29805.1 hypothetical protein ATI61_107502 [Archangium gephyra]
MPLLRVLPLIPLVLSLIACGPSHEGTVTYQVKLGPGGVIGGTITDSLRVDSTDAQWTAFLSQARASLGEAPSRFEVTNTSLLLDVTKSKNVGTLQEVLSGEVTAFLRASETGTQVDIATVDNPRGSAQLDLDPTRNSLESLEANLARGDFLLGLRGGTPRSSTGDFEAVLTLTLDVTAR